MADGWVQRMSRKRNIPYYFNTITGDTQWTEPSNTEKARGQKRARSSSSEEQNKGSSKEKTTGSALPPKENKSSSARDCSPASAPSPAKKSHLETKSKPEKQEECVSEDVPRIILPRKRRKRKKKSSTTTSESEKKSQEIEQLPPPDKAEHSKTALPAKCTKTVSTPKIEKKDIVRNVGKNPETPSPKGKGSKKKEHVGSSLPKERTVVGSDSLMEVDLPLSTEGKVLVVVDTNVLINSLYYIKFLKGRTIEDLGDVMLTIPWIVMQELDLLKGPNCMAITPLAASARKALNFLHTNRTDPDIKGQSYNNFVKTVKEKDVQGTSDDKILHYCLQCKKKYARNMVVLLSNDKNLCVKASFSGVPSSGDQGFMEEIKKQARSHTHNSFSSDDNDVFSPGNKTPSSGRGSPDGTIACLSPMECQTSGPFRNNNHDRRKTISSPTLQTYKAKRNTPTPPVQLTNARTNVHHQDVEKMNKKGMSPSTSAASSSSNDGKTELKEKKPPPQISDPAAERRKKQREYTSQMLSFLRLALVIVLRHEMIECYTDHWLEIVHKKPPWSLLDALQCIKKHYIAVFSLLLGRHNAEEVDLLISIVGKIREDDYFTSKQLDSFRFSTQSIFMPLNKNAKYKDIITKCEEDLNRVYNQWKEMVPKAPKPKTDVVIIGQSPKSPCVSSFFKPITDTEPLRAEESVQESEDMCISPPVTSSTNTLEVDVDRGALINNQEARQDNERRDGDGMDSVTFIVLSVFEAMWNVLKYHRDVIVWSFKHLASGCPIEGLPTKDESLNYLSLALPLIEAIVQSLQRLISGSIPVPVVCCAEVIESLQAYVQALKLDLDMTGFHPEMFLQFLATQDNRERLVVGSQQLTEVLQQLHECRVTLCQF